MGSTMKRMVVIFLSLVVTVLVGLATTAAAMSDRPIPVILQPEKGVIEIKDNDVQEHPIVSLQGEWEFYWKQRLEPEDFKRRSLTPAYMAVPSSWRDNKSDEPNVSSHGFGTYRLILHVPASDLGKNKSLFIRSVGSAYRLWIDGEEMPGLGTVGSSLEEEQPKSHINLVFFQPKRQLLEIVVQVSNFSFREGGISRQIVYGDTDALIPRVLKELLYDIFVIGGFLMIGIYHLIVYGLRHKELSALFVGLLSLIVSMRTLFINGYLSEELLGIESWELLTRLEYLSEIFGMLAFVYLMKSLYPREVHGVMMRLAEAVAAGLFLFVVLAPAWIYTESMLLQSALKAAILLYFILYVSFMAYLRKREGALIHVAVLIGIVCALLNDTMYYLRLLNTVELFSYSVIPFIMAQAIIVSYRYARLSRRNDMLVQKIGAVNRSLEHKVAERTKSLREANERRNRMLANIAHDLGTPLTGIQTFLQLMIKGRLSADNDKISGQLLEKTVYLKRLTDDLFELSKLESRSTEFRLERVEVRSWLEDVHAKLEADVNREGMALKLEVGELMPGTASWYVRIDRYRLHRVLQNFVDNAVKFSKGLSEVIGLRGEIRPNEDGSGCAFVLEVIDYGKGMTEAEQAHVFDRFYTNRERNESGSGLGLAIAKEIVEQHQGQVGVRSRPGASSVFYFKLPAVPEQ